MLQKKTDEPIILAKNNAIALRRGISEVTKDLFEIEKIDPEILGYGVSLKSVTAWITREMRLHGNVATDLILNLKVDGRPFFGKEELPNYLIL